MMLYKIVTKHIDSHFPMGRVFVGPDNGLFDVIAARAMHARKQEIVWQPECLSVSFHGRDLFAPVAANLISNTLPVDWLGPEREFDTCGSNGGLAKIIYIDNFGNGMTGLRAREFPTDQQFVVNGYQLVYGRTFSDVKKGVPFWYRNSNGLVEIAVNCGSAEKVLGLNLADDVQLLSGQCK